MPKGKTGLPNAGALQKAIQDPESAIRKRLVGDLEDGVLTLLNRAAAEDGECYCALYELSDKVLLQHLKGLDSKVHIVLSNAGEDTEEGSGDGDKTNQNARSELHELKLDVTAPIIAARPRRPIIGGTAFAKSSGIVSAGVA